MKKKISKRDRQMSREAYDRLTWDIGNIEAGIANRESGRVNNVADLDDLRDRLTARRTLRDAAIIICETDDEANLMAENSYR